MIKCNLVTLGDSIDGIYKGHVSKDLITGYALGQMDCENGYFLSLAELEQFAKNVWDSARSSEYEEGSRVLGADIDFAEYWAEKKKLLEKNVNEEIENV